MSVCIFLICLWIPIWLIDLWLHGSWFDLIVSIPLICLGISCWFDRRYVIPLPPVRRGALEDLEGS
jgi:hypothetical protein